MLKLVTQSGATSDIRGVPQVSWFGQGGFGDIVLHPDFASNGLVYLSYAEAGEGENRGAAVARAKLALSGNGGELQNLEVIWRQIAESRWRRALQSPHRVRRRLSVDQLRRSAEVRSRAGHERKSRQGAAAQRGRQRAARQPVRRARRRDCADLVARPSQFARARVRRTRPAVGRRDGADGRRRAEPRAARRELRLPDRQQRRSLRRQSHSRSRHAARIRGARRVVEPRDLALEPAVLRRQRVPAVARRCVDQRAVVASNHPYRVRRRHCARSRAFRHGNARAFDRAGPERRALDTRRRTRRPRR